MLTKVRNNKIISKIDGFFQGRLYPVVVALVVFAVHCLGLDSVGFLLLSAAMAFINVCCGNTRPMVATALFIVMCVSMQNSPGYGIGGESDYYGRTSTIVVIAVCAAMILISSFFRIAADGKIKELFRRKSLSVGILAFVVACALGGIFTKYYRIDNLVMALTMFGGLLFAYAYWSVTVEKRDDNFLYISRVCVLVALEVVAQIGFLYLKKFDFGDPLNDAWKGNIIVGWGVSNSVGELVAFMLPFSFYIMYKEERGFWYFFVVVVSMVGIYFTLSRCALLFSVPIAIAGSIVNCVAGKNKKQNRVMVLISLLVLFVIIVVLAKTGAAQKLLRFFLDAKFKDRGRFAIWDEMFGYFKEYPVFGSGFSAYMIAHGKISAFHGMAHNTLVQVVSSTGVVGSLAYVYHRFETVKLFVKNPSVDKCFMAAAILCFLCMSLFDSIFFYANFTVFYTAILTIVEKGNPSSDESTQAGEVKANE